MQEIKIPGWVSIATVIVLSILLAVGIRDYLIQDFSTNRLVYPLTRHWLGTIIVSVLFLILAATVVTGHPFAFLIDERNRYSLSRLQLLLWLILIVPAILITFLQNYKIPPPKVTAYFTGAITGVQEVNAGCTLGDMLLSDGVCHPEGFNVDEKTITGGALGQALVDGTHIYLPDDNSAIQITLPTNAEDEPTGRDFNIPQEILLLLGISATSLVASPFLKSNKDQSATDESKIFRNENRNRAQLSDLIKGEENQNRNNIDLAKVQMLYVTLALVLAYGIALVEMFQVNANTVITQFPPVAAGVVGLLGISHAGYLADKAISKEIKGITFTAVPDQNNSRVFQFDVSATDTNTFYAWDFGDQQSGTGRSVNHTYTAPGTYIVRLIARGHTGISEGEQTLNVQ